MKYYNPVIDDGIIYSCDMIRLCFSFFRNRTDELMGWLENIFVFDDYFTIEHYNRFNFFSYRHLFSFKHDDEVLTLGIGFNGVKSDDREKSFVEFNPNKCNFVEVKRILEKLYFFAEPDDSLHKFSLKRWDLAIDLPFDRDLCFLLPEGKKENHVIKCNGSKTEYNGKRNHAGFCKLYDKTKESNLDYTLTRLEITYEGFDTNYLPVVQVFNYQLEMSLDLNKTQLVLVELIRQQPVELQHEYLKRLGRSVSAKIKPFLFNEKNNFKINPFSVLQVKENVRRILELDIDV